MTAAEQARTAVEAWALQWLNPPHFDLMHTGWLRDLIARLTPVFERAQEVTEANDLLDEWKADNEAARREIGALRERAEREALLRKEMHESLVEAERKGDELRERVERAEAKATTVQFWKDTARNKDEACQALRERAQRADTTWRAVEASMREASRMRAVLADAKVARYDEGWRNSEADAQAWRRQAKAAEADVARLRTALQVATDYNGVAGKERDGMAQRVPALEGDVARLKEDFDEVCKDRNRIRQDVARLREALSDVESYIPKWAPAAQQMVCEALAATEPKR